MDTEDDTHYPMRQQMKLVFREDSDFDVHFDWHSSILLLCIGIRNGRIVWLERWNSVAGKAKVRLYDSAASVLSLIILAIILPFSFSLLG